jgi:glutamate dehydrogenase
VVKLVPTVVDSKEQQQWQKECEYYHSLGLTKDMSHMMVMPIRLFSGLGIAETAKMSTNATIKKVVTLHSMLGDQLGLYWFAHLISDVHVKTFWQAAARETFIDDLDRQLRHLCVAILRLAGDNDKLQQTFTLWEQQHYTLRERWRSVLHGLKAAKDIDYAMFSVAMRELFELTQATEHCQSLDDDSVDCQLGDK